MRLPHLLLMLAMASQLSATHTLHADDTNSTGSGDGTPTPSVPADGVPAAPVSADNVAGGPVSADKETSALAFAEDHHPELKALVESLKTANPEGYRKAINDLHRTQERIIRLTDKNPVRAAHELELWKIDSRIRLTAARSAMGDPQGQREDLRALVEQRQSLKLKWMKEERKQVVDRLSKLDSDLQSAQTKEAAAIDAEVDRLLKSVKSKQSRVVATQRESRKKGKVESNQGKATPAPMTPASDEAGVAPEKSSEPTPVTEPEVNADPVPPATPEPLPVIPQL